MKHWNQSVLQQNKIYSDPKMYDISLADSEHM